MQAKETKGINMKPKKLSATQEKVMKWLRAGWKAEVTHGAAVSINGTRVCNLDTIAVLVKAGLVVKCGHWTYKAAPQSHAITCTPEHA